MTLRNVVREGGGGSLVTLFNDARLIEQWGSSINRTDQDTGHTDQQMLCWR